MDQRFKIEIDFLGGCHGNFLEFVLNSLLLDDLELKSPFTDIGTSHAKHRNYDYNSKRIVKADHYFQSNISFTSKNIIVITVTPDSDILQLMSISLYRAADKKIIDNALEVDTFNKLNSSYYKSLLSNISNSYNIKLSNESPDCPRYILREFFKFGFKNMEINGFVEGSADAIKKINLPTVYKFPIQSFYDFDLFDKELKQIEKFFDLKYNNFDYASLHKKFIFNLSNFLSLTKTANDIIDQIKNRIECKIQNLTLLQESYINAILENTYGKEMPFVQPQYFTNTKEIIEYLEL